MRNPIKWDIFVLRCMKIKWCISILIIYSNGFLGNVIRVQKEYNLQLQKMLYVENEVNKVCNDTKSQSQSNERKSYLVPEFGPIDTMG